MSNFSIKNVRVSYPSLFEQGTYGGESTGKYECTFLLNKKEHAAQIKAIKAATAELIKSNLKGAKLSADKLALKDGDESDKPENKGCYTIKTSTKKRPLVIDRDKTPLTEADNKFYAGCYVNAIFSLWAQDNGYGKRINASLDGVQFNGDGEAFGEGGIGIDGFDVFDDEDDDIQF